MGSEQPGEWLARQMERRDISVPQVAAALDVTTKTVYYWRSGKTEVNEDRVPRLAEVLGISELEARGGLGFWVPQADTAEPLTTEQRDELEDLREMLTAALDRIEKLQRKSG